MKLRKTLKLSDNLDLSAVKSLVSMINLEKEKVVS